MSMRMPKFKPVTTRKRITVSQLVKRLVKIYKRVPLEELHLNYDKKLIRAGKAGCIFQRVLVTTNVANYRDYIKFRSENDKLRFLESVVTNPIDNCSPKQEVKKAITKFAHELGVKRVWA